MNSPEIKTTTLNPRQLLFAQHILRGSSLTDAYRDAGYTAEGPAAHTGASKLLYRPEIAAYLHHRQTQATLKTIVDRQELLTRLTSVLRSEAADLDEIPAHQVIRKTILKPDGTHSIATTTRSMSKHAAIRQLAQLLGHGKPIIEPAEPLSLHQTETPAPQRIGQSLNPRQRLFCENLSRGQPASHAYAAAGYLPLTGESTENSVHRLIQRPAVAQYLHDLQHLASLPSHADGDELLSFLTLTIRASRKDLETQARFIDQVVETRLENHDSTVEHRTWVKSVSPPRAMHQLARLLGLHHQTTPNQPHPASVN